MSDDLIGTAEAAEALGVSPVTVARYVRQGRLTPAETLPYGRGVYRFRRSDVDELADQSNPRRIAARALREAADEWNDDENVAMRWLRERAKKIERGEV